ncbi:MULTISPECIES: hypothetical protein [unclassified Bradyrhizobium]|uniref:hypothetical protein n=1 Tax=unclassified Bradyrhizobium TaxID=2631580 RepID=UPI002479184D|nr:MULTISPECIES: hypothetical protein [unclassified Bradyrhizobium]WGR72641.1 hypothetical protein MTX24_06810 [Bradyrhizobium sp. ISRA426]WGR77474.1 hypothetical protein MTX21_31760 [Bradyrhizobium sp. ISRA430]WGR87880.1 hypothetical protein MTX25_06810 [Bradyrhizobium sp. ISRA432]
MSEQHFKAHALDDFLIIAAHYGDLKGSAQDGAIRNHLAEVEQSYRVLAKSRKLLSSSTASVAPAMRSRPMP